MPANASAEYFLKIDDVKGESSKKGFEKQIEIESFSWSASQSGGSAVGGGSGVGGVSMSDFQFSTKMNTSSPTLMVACATGKHYKSAVLTARKAGGSQQAYLTWTLSDCMISSYVTGAHNGSDTVPTDTFSVTFKKIQVGYKPQNADQTLGAEVPGGFDLAKMEAV